MKSSNPKISKNQDYQVNFLSNVPTPPLIIQARNYSQKLESLGNNLKSDVSKSQITKEPNPFTSQMMIKGTEIKNSKTLILPNIQTNSRKIPISKNIDSYSNQNLLEQEFQDLEKLINHAKLKKFDHIEDCIKRHKVSIIDHFKSIKAEFDSTIIDDNHQETITSIKEQLSLRSKTLKESLMNIGRSLKELDQNLEIEKCDFNRFEEEMIQSISKITNEFNDKTEKLHQNTENFKETSEKLNETTQKLNLTTQQHDKLKEMYENSLLIIDNNQKSFLEQKEIIEHLKIEKENIRFHVAKQIIQSKDLKTQLSSILESLHHQSNAFTTDADFIELKKDLDIQIFSLKNFLSPSKSLEETGLSELSSLSIESHSDQNSSLIDMIDSINNDKISLVEQLLKGQALLLEEIKKLQTTSKVFQENNSRLSRTLQEKENENKSLNKTIKELKTKEEIQLQTLNNLKENIDKQIIQANYKSRIESLEQELKSAKDLLLQYEYSQPLEDSSNTLEIKKIQELLLKANDENSKLSSSLQILSFA